MIVDFKYEIDELVKTKIGTVGIITAVGVLEKGIEPSYFVKAAQTGDWWKESQLTKEAE
ncbi:hypothetical protein FACS1894110_09880 [Spirochaetia bacterium]|nr:hypothetical protein FACS1894110_09880 [Spirochaetia bacterium]